MASKGTCDVQRLIRYKFTNGQLVSKEVILTASIDKVRYELGKNHIYKNRYVITHWGDVVDLQDKKLLHRGDGQFITAQGDQIIIRVNKSNIKGIFSYNLKTNQYTRLKSLNKWELPGVLSPDQTRSASVNPVGRDQIWLHTLSGQNTLLGSGFLASLSNYSADLPRPPLYWLNNDSILTQQSNGKLVILRTNGTVEPFIDIPIEKAPINLARFYTDQEGRLIYQSGDVSFVIDVENKTYSKLEWSLLGYGFEAEYNENPSYGAIIRYKGKEIGRLWVDVWGARTIDQHIAMEYGPVGSNLGYPKGIKIWSNVTEKWTTIDVDWQTGLVGWVEW